MPFEKKTILAALFFCVAGIMAASAAPGRQVLHGLVPAAVAHLTPRGSLPATNQLRLAIALPLRNEDALNKLLQETYDPASPKFHHYLTPDQFTEQFGPTKQDYQTVINFALANGLKVTATHPNRVLVDVSGSAATVEKVFHVSLRVYRHPAENRNFFAPDGEPSIDLGVPVAHVSGLDNFIIPRPAIIKKKLPTNKLSGAVPAAGSGPGGLYMGNDFRAAYVPGTVLNGAGQTVGLFELDGYFTNDIAQYEAIAGLPNVTLTNVFIDGYSGAAGSNNVEVALDIEMAMAMATNLSKVIVYEGQNGGNIADFLNRIATDNLAKQISSSWIIGDNSSYDTAYKQMAMQGQSFFQAAGDDGAYYSGIAQWADDTNITLVGGTTLSTTGPGGAWSSETVWNWYGTGQGTAGGGGGVNFNGVLIPSWQTGISMTGNQGSPTLRNVPDVALTADNIFVVADNGTNYSVGGTSAAAPLWAGFTALVNQQAALVGGSTVGFLNPAIYAIGKSTNYALNFHDITTGNNTNTTVGNNYFAVPGYDLCTGWGTPVGQNLINTFVPPDTLTIAPLNGFNSSGVSGGLFSPSSQDFLLTNSSASPLTWSLISTSSWLNVSVTNGTLAANATNGVTISLNAAANSLAVGTYVANVKFTNWNSHVVQTLQFSIQVLESLAVAPTNGFTAIGAVGGPFSVTAENFSLSNASASLLNWQAGNAPAWLAVSPSGGAIGGGVQTTVTASLDFAASNLVAGIYPATLFFTNQPGGTAQSRQFTLSIGQSVIQNGGFETGDLTGWTLNGNGIVGDELDNGVVNSRTFTYHYGTNFIHSGTYGMAMGDTSLAYLSQTVPTLPGASYLISFWMNNHTGDTPNQFLVNWNTNAAVTNTLFNATNIGVLTWTNMMFIVTAGGTNAVLQFGALNVNDYFGLDDVSVTPVSPPLLTAQPDSLTVLSGGNAIFSAAASGASPLVYQWRKNGVNFANGAGIAGATSNVLTLTAVTTNSSGNYSLFVTNIFGTANSSVAVLTVVLPPSITASSLTNRTVQCGANTNIFTITVVGTAPFFIQWSTNNVPVISATNVSFALTNLHLATVTNVAVAVTNFYGGATNSAGVTVIDTLAPTITLNGANPLYVELGSAFTDPGATASDACAGALAVVVSGTVNTNSVSTNIVFYTASDGGNSATNSRTVIVRDTTPPPILWSFTNLIVAANSNCVALLPNVTGTNFILATDLSGALTITQTPTNNFPLPLGTNTIVITVADASGNTAFSTNTVVVQDQTPPVIFSQPQSQTNFIGTTATFSVAATACTPLTFQWYSNNAALTIFTNTTLALSNLTLSAAGNYFVVASANGGATTSAVATLTVNLIPPAINSVTANANGSFNLNLTGSPGYIYILQATTNLLPPVNWLPLATNTLGTNGVWLFTDTSATNFPLQFYRLKLGP